MERLDQWVFDGGMTSSSIDHLPIDPRPVLLVGGAGMTGSRVARRMQARGLPVRAASRSMLFTELLDGRTVTPTTTVQRLLGRPAGTFAEGVSRTRGTLAATAEPGRATS